MTTTTNLLFAKYNKRLQAIQADYTRLIAVMGQNALSLDIRLTAEGWSPAESPAFRFDEEQPNARAEHLFQTMRGCTIHVSKAFEYTGLIYALAEMGSTKAADEIETAIRDKLQKFDAYIAAASLSDDEHETLKIQELRGIIAQLGRAAVAFSQSMRKQGISQ